MPSRELRNNFVVTTEKKRWFDNGFHCEHEKCFYLVFPIQNFKLFKMIEESWGYNDLQWRKLQHIRRDQFQSRLVTMLSVYVECAVVVSIADHYFPNFLLSF